VGPRHPSLRPIWLTCGGCTGRRFDNDQGNTNSNPLKILCRYVRDSIHMTRKFTLNFGLRYGLFRASFRKTRQLQQLRSDHQALTSWLETAAALYQPDYKNWARAVSAAWTSPEKAGGSAGGLGRFYDAFSQGHVHGPFHSTGLRYGTGLIPQSSAPPSDFLGRSIWRALNTVDPVYGPRRLMRRPFWRGSDIRSPSGKNYN